MILMFKLFNVITPFYFGISLFKIIFICFICACVVVPSIVGIKALKKKRDAVKNEEEK